VVMVVVAAKPLDTYHLPPTTTTTTQAPAPPNKQLQPPDPSSPPHQPAHLNFLGCCLCSCILEPLLPVHKAEGESIRSQCVQRTPQRIRTVLWIDHHVEVAQLRGQRRHQAGCSRAPTCRSCRARRCSCSGSSSRSSAPTPNWWYSSSSCAARGLAISSISTWPVLICIICPRWCAATRDKCRRGTPLCKP
jgi:hypothetical protein